MDKDEIVAAILTAVTLVTGLLIRLRSYFRATIEAEMKHKPRTPQEEFEETRKLIRENGELTGREIRGLKGEVSELRGSIALISDKFHWVEGRVTRLEERHDD